MEALYSAVILVHGLCGAVALVCYWIAALAKKGSPQHRFAGRIYMMAMIVIVLSAIPIAIKMISVGRPAAAVFYAYLVLITATGLWMAWRAIKRKRDQTAFRSGAYPVVAAMNIVLSIAVLWLGFVYDRPVLIGFSGIGLFTGAFMFYRRARPMTIPRWWLKEHLTWMVGSAVPTHVAFLSIGLESVVLSVGMKLPEWYASVAWFGPMFLAIAGVFWTIRRYVPRQGVGAEVISSG